MSDDRTGLDRITVTRISAFGYHGVLAEEREAGQQFGVDVTLHLDVAAAAAGDDLTRTVNYADVASDVVAVITGPPVDLIETVAVAIADRALAYDGVVAVDVTVHKPYAPIPVPFDDVTVQVHRRARQDRTREVVVALGANLGDARQTLHNAVTELDRHARVAVSAVSPLLRSTAVVLPGSPPQPDYLNAVAALSTDLPPRELLALCQGIELGHGRRRTTRWAPRTLDIDIIASGDLRRDDDDLVIPHPRAHERPFVIAPWLRLDPAAVLPGHGPVAGLPAASGEGLEWLTGTWWSREAEG
ncbi:2-amino-4-hydroxy-6-hydroxymethyldihydropteridine diphosphokinase [Georgenia sp. MJ170]|uniref:2-amino-4-hydroxy-6- hydroxymethyldihydropteridine diphosphokinase n=1 Tax=Georgenia sunbinii TaxID=3117728 RepID=UPI002F266BEB